MGRNIGENISRNLSGKYNFLTMLNNLLQIHLKLLQKKQLKKKTEATGDFIGNKIADRITKVSKTSP